MSSFLDHIPTFRRIPGALWRLLRPLLSRRLWTRIAFVFACLLTLAMAFYTVERWRWRVAWEDYAAQARKRGVKLMISEFHRSAVTDAENFGRIPFFEGYYQKPEVPDGLNGPVFNLVLNSFSFGWARAQKVSPAEAGRNIAAMPAMQQLLNSAKQDGAPTPVSNAIEWTPEAAKTLLGQLDKECGEVSRQLRVGADRPFSQFPADGYDDDTRTPKRPPFIRLRKAAQLENIRLGLHAAAGDGAAALDDLRICLRLTDATKSEPYFVASGIRTAMAALTMESVWTGLSEGVWDDAQLDQIDQWLSGIELISSYQFAIETERAAANKMYQRFASESLKDLHANEKNWVKRIAPRFFPKGWVYRSQIKSNQFFDTASAQVDLSLHTIHVDPESEERKISEASKIQDYLFLLATPGYSRGTLRTAASEALVRQARVACALERRRLKHGAYPQNLDELVTAKLLPALPRDPINNAPMEYQRTDDGRYALRSAETTRLTRDVAPWPEAWMPGH
jgi:hypothetical protein